jgi:hypothetical protein
MKDIPYSHDGALVRLWYTFERTVWELRWAALALRHPVAWQSNRWQRTHLRRMIRLDKAARHRESQS